MEFHRAHVYRLYPTPEQLTLLARAAGVVRLVYNLALEQRRTWGGRPYRGGRSRSFGSKGLSGELSALRREFPWIGEVSQTAQNQALIDLDRAFTNFFEGRARLPTPRKRGVHDAFRHVGREVAIRRLNGKWSEVRIPKIGWVRYRDTRPLRERADGVVEIRSATVLRGPDGAWQVSIALRCEVEARPVPARATGVDRGVAIPFALADGSVWHLPETVARRERLISRLQRKLARRTRGSQRYRLLRSRIARLRGQNARARKHLAHVLTTHLARTFGLVAIEDLRILNMTRSAAGTVEDPGRNVAAKSGLNRAILNVGWYQFELLLSYKLEETGGVMIKVPARNTSRECAECGHVDEGSRKNQATFVCTACGHAANADHNAAINILNRALRGDETRPRRNTPLLDGEGNALAPGEPSTPSGTAGVTPPNGPPEIHLSSGGGRC
ncbi:MAG: transposase [Gemmobacter sp.]|nr:transposase [Gemmobacter sp.]